MTNEKKPREFWIAPKLYNPIDEVEAEYYVAFDLPGDPKRLEIHVIEYSAYQKLREERDHWKRCFYILHDAKNESK